MKILGDFRNKVILVRWRRLDYDESLFVKYLGETIECIIRKQKCLCLGLTVLHSAIQTALIMGAKKITLVSCEAEYTKYPSHAQKRGMSYFYAETPNSKYSSRELERLENIGTRQKKGTKALTKVLSQFGIPVRQFYYTKGYRKIK